MQYERTLSDLMEFEHVIRVENGVATDRMPDGERIPLWAPECINDGFTRIGETAPRHIEQGTGWTLMDGYSGQYGYSGPIMHASEFIGDGCTMHRDILATDGYYVTVVCTVLSDCTCGREGEPYGNLHDDDCPINSGEDDVAGWAVAYRPLEGE